MLSTKDIALFCHYFFTFSELLDYIGRWYGSKFLLFSSSWLFALGGSWLTMPVGFGCVSVLQAIPCFSWWEGLSALALMFLILTTTVKACSKASSVGYANFLGHNIQSGVIFHVAISVSLLVFVVFRLKLTLGCFSAVMLSFRYASDRASLT